MLDNVRFIDSMEVPSKYCGKEGFSIGLMPNRLTQHVDPGIIKKVQDALKEGKIPTSIIPEDIQHFAAISSFQPREHTTVPYMLSYVQGGYIGDTLLASLVAGPDERGAWPELDYSAFGVDPDMKGVAINGPVPMSDFVITWHNFEIKVVPRGTKVDRRLRDAGVTLPTSTDAIASNLVDTQLKTQKEYEQATFIRDTGNYLSSDYYANVAGTDKWTDDASKPIDMIVNGDETLRAGPARTRADVLWFSPKAFLGLRKSAQIKEAVKYTGTWGQPGTLVPIEVIVALFGKNVVIGDSGGSTVLGGTPTDLWGSDAGLVCTGQGRILGVRFAFTGTSSGYPVYRVVPVELEGGKGSDAIVETDAWSIESVKKSAAYLWKDPV